jgi:hypothetical protein
VHQSKIEPKTAHRGPAQRGKTPARDASPRTRPQPGPGPGKRLPAWAESGPRARPLSAVVGSNPTAVRPSRAGKTPRRSRSPQTLGPFCVFLHSLLPRPLPLASSSRRRRRRRRRRGPPRRRARSPVRERAAVEWARGGQLARAPRHGGYPQARRLGISVQSTAVGCRSP